MLQQGRVWFLLADGRRARLVVEPKRGAPLEEKRGWDLTIGPQDLYDVQDRPPRAFESVGGGRHAMDRGRNLHEEEERKFLRRLADRIEAAEKARLFDHLVIAAPPRALGTLRSALPDAARTRLAGEIPKDLLDEDIGRLRDRLRDVLRH